MNLYIKLSTLLILEIGRLLFIFPYESLEMSGDEKPIDCQEPLHGILLLFSLITERLRG